MTPIIVTKDTTISTADITWNHVVVAIINEKPCLLGKGFDEPAEKLSFRVIGSDNKEADTATGTFGNGWDFNNKARTPNSARAFHSLFVHVPSFHVIALGEQVKFILSLIEVITSHLQ